MSPPSTVRHILEYGAYRSIAGALSLAPEVVADRLGASVGWVTARTVRLRWEVAMTQLKFAFPERDSAWRLAVARRCYAHLGAEAIAMVRMGGMTGAQVKARTELRGFELVEESVSQGQGVVAVTGHLGNWEIGGAAVAARGLPVDVVVARQRNRLFDERIQWSRGRLGLNVIPRGKAPSQVLASLRAGRVVGILGDQDARQAGVFVEFFGRLASTARGPAVLALRSGARLLVAVALREPGARPRYSVHFEPVDAPRTGDLRRDVTALTQAYTSRLEDFIRKAPEQYFWLHRRWKTVPGSSASGTGTPHEAYQVNPPPRSGF